MRSRIRVKARRIELQRQDVVRRILYLNESVLKETPIADVSVVNNFSAIVPTERGALHQHFYNLMVQQTRNAPDVPPPSYSSVVANRNGEVIASPIRVQGGR